MPSINRRTLLKGLGVGGVLYAVSQLLPIVRDVAEKRLPFLALGGKHLFTIGWEGVAYATTPDYTVDGDNDDVQVQAALDALPATGGEIVLYAGTYDFHAEVSRAIDNVTIRGGGKGTIVNRNGADPVFSAGARSGWLFLDFATDAGGITVASATNTYRRGVWINGVYTDDTISPLLPKQMVENDPLLLDATISADEKYSGICEAGVAGTTLDFGNLIYFAVADSRWELTDADAPATSFGKLGICVTVAQKADGDAIVVLLWGKVRNVGFPTLTVGAPVFVSTTAGDVQVAAPSGTTDVVRIVGYGNTAAELFFCPDNTYLELV